jgi:two-component system response regulator MprA
VLIVDESAECREVLRTALERTGTEALEATTAAEGLRALESFAPDVVVLDLEKDDGLPRLACQALQAAAQRRDTPIVILGTAHRAFAGGGVHWVSKPYHFGPLVRRIESLLRAYPKTV